MKNCLDDIVQVYIVRSRHNPVDIEGVFSTRELAKEYISTKIFNEQMYIKVRTLDEFRT